MNAKTYTLLRSFKLLIRGFLLSFALGCAWAQPAPGYPSKPLRLIVPNPPGGSIDIVARQLANGLAAELGQPVVIENRGGASGMVGAQLAAAAPADGYTLLLASSSVLSINPVSFSKIPYDPVENFTPVSLLTTQPLTFSVTAESPAKSLGQFIQMAKARPGQLNFANTGTSASLPFFHFQHLAGVNITAIPYPGAVPGINALLGGQVEILAITIGTIQPMLQARKVRALAVTSLERSALQPDVPTVAELGFPGYQVTVWNGLVVPAGTPREVVNRLNRAVVKVMSQPEVRTHFEKDGTQVATTTPEKFGEFIRSELERWKKVAKDSGIAPVAQ